MSYSIINPAVIEENMMNNDALIMQFLDLYQKQIPTDLASLREAVTTEVHAEIADKAHHIKPTMEYIGAQALQEKLQRLENAGKEGVAITDILSLFLEIEDDIAMLLQEITDYRQSR